MSTSRHIYAVIGILATLSALSLSSGHVKLATPLQNVVIKNTAANPIPTVAQGNTTISGTVSFADGSTVGVNSSALNPVHVNVDNAPTVSVSTLPAISLANGTANPVPVRVVDGGSKQAIDNHNAFTLDVNDEDDSFVVYSVPLGKVFTLTDASGAAETPNSQDSQMSLSRDDGLAIQLPLSLQGTFFSTTTRTGTLSGLNYKFPAGTTITLNASRSAFTLQAFFKITISGYLEDAP